MQFGENNFTLIDNGSQSGSQRGTFLLKIDQVGNICWVRRIKAFSSGFATVCVLKSQGENLYAGGQFSGDVDFDLSIGSYYSYGSSDPFITKWTLHDQYLSTEADLEIKSQVLYPNPTNENLFLKESNITNLQIYDLSGREVNPDYYFNGEIHRINTAELSNGAYILSYEKGKSLFAERFVVQH